MSALPTGSITFLFTDVEGSTGLLQRLGEGYTGVLERHRSLLREAFGEHGGVEVDCRGDEFFVAFPEGHDAVEAAVSAQRLLAAEPWPERGEVRVRMGLHTGTAEVVGDGYFGLDVHRAARICQEARGGEILLSASTQAIAGREAEDLGEHDLKGLPAPERLFRAVGDGLPSPPPPPEPSGPPALRVVLADDSVLLREGIARLLEDAGFVIAAQAADYDDLMLKVRSYSPDVALVDIRMPPTYSDEGVRAAKQIREHHPATGVLVLSQYVEPEYAMELLGESAEGVGYLLKDRVADVDEFVSAVRRVGEGGSALDPSIVTQLVGRRRRDDPIDHLTPRERQVLELMAEGKSNRGIAEKLVVTERAVEKHVTSIFGKLRLAASSEDHRRVLAVLTLLRSE